MQVSSTGISAAWTRWWARLDIEGIRLAGGERSRARCRSLSHRRRASREAGRGSDSRGHPRERQEPARDPAFPGEYSSASSMVKASTSTMERPWRRISRASSPIRLPARTLSQGTRRSSRSLHCRLVVSPIPSHFSRSVPRTLNENHPAVSPSACRLGALGELAGRSVEGAFETVAGYGRGTPRRRGRIHQHHLPESAPLLMRSHPHVRVPPELPPQHRSHQARLPGTRDSRDDDQLIEGISTGEDRAGVERAPTMRSGRRSPGRRRCAGTPQRGPGVIDAGSRRISSTLPPRQRASKAPCPGPRSIK